MRGRPWIAASLVALLALSGCLGDAPPTGGGGDGSAQAPDAPGGYTLACPDGTDTVQREAVCLTRIEEANAAHTEPWIAVHPDGPDTLAVGVNTGETTGAAPEPTAPQIQPRRLSLFVTTDAGASWTKHRFPAVPTDVPTPGGIQFDPALAFDANGTLHATGIATTDQMRGASSVFYTATSDLGESWTEPAILSEQGNTDRNWVSVVDGVLYATWQRGSPYTGQLGAGLAWSTDGGQTWTKVLGEGALEGCNFPSPVEGAQGAALLTCLPSGEEVFEVLEVRPDDGRLEDRSTLPLPRGNGFRALLANAGNGSLFAVGPGGYAAHSADAGRSWGEPARIYDLASVDDGWDENLRTFAAETDAWDRVHVLFGDFRHVTPQNARHAAHVVLEADPSGNLSLVEERSLLPPADQQPTNESQYPNTGDEFWGLAFHGEQGWAAWTYHDGVEVARILPNATAS